MLLDNKTSLLKKKEISQQILHFIKTEHEVTAGLLSEKLGITKEGARLHLVKLHELGYIQKSTISKGVGRPITIYHLTEKGEQEFPDAHAQITVDLLNSVKRLLGDNALELLISDKEKETYNRYQNQLAACNTLESRLEMLAKLRTQEGYMAQWERKEDGYYLIENHCPICAAATACQGFCRAELKNFKQLIGDDYQVERTKHIVSGGQRCVYRITEK